MEPTACTAAMIAAGVGHVEHTGGAASLAARPSSSPALMSVAITRAPSRAKASAVARPMPLAGGSDEGGLARQA